MNRTGIYTYLVAVWIFMAAVFIQVLFAGLVVVARQMSWELHTGFGHMVGLPLLVMLVAMYVARMPANIKQLTWLLFAVFFVQAEVIIFLRDSLPYVSAFHPVLALLDVVLGWTLIKNSISLLQSPSITKEPIQVAAKPAK